MNDKLNLFEIKCSYCKDIYFYRIYDNNKLILETKKKSSLYEFYYVNYLCLIDIKAKVSHGICKPCTKIEYKKLGLEGILK